MSLLERIGSPIERNRQQSSTAQRNARRMRVFASHFDALR